MTDDGMLRCLAGCHDLLNECPSWSEKGLCDGFSWHEKPVADYWCCESCGGTAADNAGATDNDEEGGIESDEEPASRSTTPATSSKANTRGEWPVPMLLSLSVGHAVR